MTDRVDRLTGLPSGTIEVSSIFLPGFTGHAIDPARRITRGGSVTLEIPPNAAAIPLRRASEIFWSVMGSSSRHHIWARV